MELKLYFRMLQRSWWIVAITAMTGLLVSLIASFLTTPVYRTTARFIVSPNPAYLGENQNVLDSIDTLDKRSIVTTYAEILNSPRIYDETVNLLQLNPVEFDAYKYEAVVLPDTNIIEFAVQGPNAQTVSTLANNIGDRTIRFVQGLYPVYDFTLLDPAAVPMLPISPQPLRDAGISLVIGLALGVGLALVRELARAPIEQFKQQRDVDEVSLALRRTAFENRLADIAFGSTEDFSLSIVYLEGLKEYSNVLPQPTLQTILRHVTQTLKNQLRGNDLVGRSGEVDFSVLLSETQGDAAMNTMERVRAALSIPIKIDVSGEDLYLRPQIGIAEYRVGDTAQSLIKNTNWALEMARMNSNIYLLRATEPL